MRDKKRTRQLLELLTDQPARKYPTTDQTNRNPNTNDTTDFVSRSLYESILRVRRRILQPLWSTFVISYYWLFPPRSINFEASCLLAKRYGNEEEEEEEEERGAQAITGSIQWRFAASFRDVQNQPTKPYYPE